MSSPSFVANTKISSGKKNVKPKSRGDQMKMSSLCSLRPLKWKGDFCGGRRHSRRLLSHFSRMQRQQRLFLTGTPTPGSDPVTYACMESASIWLMQMLSFWFLGRILTSFPMKECISFHHQPLVLLHFCSLHSTSAN